MKKAINAETDQDKRYSEYRAFDKHKYYIFKIYRIIRRLNRKYRFQKTLDVACADGSFSAKLKKDFGFETHGIDISKNAVKSANNRGVKAKVHNLEKAIPYPDGSFDLVLASEVIEHLYDTDFFISELKRVLRKGGILILTTPNLVSLTNRVRILFGKYPNFVPEYRIPGGAGHIRAYTVPILKQQLKEYKLNIISIVTSNVTFPMRSRFAPKFLKEIAIRLGDWFPKIGSDMIFVLRK
ncbi:MAG: class I SAM-dependent methyltransferase [Nanoarchaeota archaeon]|nr:class I SAM-dependent methyltransferase [Nanoarchaeota archaeon]